MILKGKGASNLRSRVLADLGELRLVKAPFGGKSVALFWSEFNSRYFYSTVPSTTPQEVYDDSLELIDDAETVLSLLQSLKAGACQEHHN